MRNTFMCFGNQPNTDFNDSLSDQASWIEPLESRLLLSGTHYVVNSLLDVVADDGVVTLREAIEAANTNTAVTADVSAGCVEVKDLITFDSLLVAAGPVSIVMGGMELEIVDGLKIVGPGAGLLIVDADGSSYVLRVYGVGVEVEISGLTVIFHHTIYHRQHAGVIEYPSPVIIISAIAINTVARHRGIRQRHRSQIIPYSRTILTRFIIRDR